MKGIEKYLMKELTKILSKQNISVLTSLSLSYKALAKASFSDASLGRELVYRAYDQSGKGSVAVEVIIGEHGTVFVKRLNDERGDVVGVIPIESVFEAAFKEALIPLMSGIVNGTKNNVIKLVKRIYSRAKVKLNLNLKKHRIEYTNVIIKKGRGMVDSLFRALLKNNERAVFKSFLTIKNVFLVGAFEITGVDVPEFYAYPFSNKLEFSGTKAGYARLGELNPTEFVEVLAMAND